MSLFVIQNVRNQNNIFKTRTADEDVVLLKVWIFSNFFPSKFTPNISFFTMENHLKECIYLNTFSHLLKMTSYLFLHITTNNQLWINFESFLSFDLHLNDKTQDQHHIVALFHKFLMCSKSFWKSDMETKKGFVL